MLTIKQFITACGLRTPHDRIKLARHSSHLGRDIRRVISDGVFETYQSEQYAVVRPFHNCDVILSWKELKEIAENPASHPDWVTAMKFTAAIYRIVDLENGKTYIGSAYGKEGLWHRWCDYARSGHGGNKMLIGLDYGKFQWLIVRTLSGVMSKRDVILIEQLEKAKHGSRAIGLNGN